MSNHRNISYEDFCTAPGKTVESLAFREVALLTRHGKPLATITRMPGEKAEIDMLVPADAAPLSVTAAMGATFDRAQALLQGAKFILGRGGRREAVIEGVKA